MLAVEPQRSSLMTFKTYSMCYTLSVYSSLLSERCLMQPPVLEPLVLKVDAIQIHVPDLDAGLRFYRDQLGHQLIWRTERAAGLRLPESDAELVLQTEREGLELNLLVASADQAAQRIVEAGDAIVVPPFDIQIGRCVGCVTRGGQRWCFWIRVKVCSLLMGMET
jgi:predicted enzyme related to lactoylglutathione lyase